jgi:segregation and condensation protein A
MERDIPSIPPLEGPAGPLDVDLSTAHPFDVARVRVGSFDGPLALLLSLIESRELDVLSVPLGELAEAFVDALARIEGERIGSLSGFVSVAAQLILVKSRAMLPGPPPGPRVGEEEAVDPEEELRRRLLVYRAFRDAGAELGARLGEAAGGLFHREAAVALASAGVAARSVAPPQPVEPLEPRLLADALAALGRVTPPPEPPPERLGRTISVEERAAVIRAALRDAPLVVLQDLLHGVRDRVVAAITFLAMLELVKQREISVAQDEPWGPIVCRPLA